MYVKSGYVEFGYVDSDLSQATKKKINFIVDNKNLSDSDLNSQLLEKIGKNYQDEINLIFANSIKIAEKVDDTFSIKEIAGKITNEELIEDANFIDEFSKKIKDNLTGDADFMNYFSSKVAEKITFNLIAKDGEVITSDFVYDADKNAYVLNYDTAQLDGSDYTIEIALSS